MYKNNTVQYNTNPIQYSPIQSNTIQYSVPNEPEVISGIKSKVKKLHQEQDRVLGNILDDHKERKQMTKTAQGKAGKI